MDGLHERKVASGASSPRLGALHTEEQSFPASYLIHHRMGLSTVHLSAPQQRQFQASSPRNADGKCTEHSPQLEAFLLYKQQKYNAVNSLWRFSLLLLVLTLCTMCCLVFSAITSEWFLLTSVNGRSESNQLQRTIGIYVRCETHNALLPRCPIRHSAYSEMEVVDCSTGNTICKRSSSTARLYVGFLWTMMSLHMFLSCIVAFILNAYLVLRPTRLGTLKLQALNLLLGLLLGIADCIVFANYISCDRQACRAHHIDTAIDSCSSTSGLLGDEGSCTARLAWGYRLYMAATILNGPNLICTLWIMGYMYSIRAKAEKIVRRPKRNVQGGGTMARPQELNGSRRTSATSPRLQSGQRSSEDPSRRSPNPLHGDDDGDASHGEHRSRHPSGDQRHLRIVSIEVPPGAAMGDGPAGGQSKDRNTAHPLHVTFAGASTGATDPFTAEPSISGDSRPHEPFPVATPVERQTSSVVTVSRGEGSMHPAMLTAEELGVEIQGAHDWVYDDKSDMFYSFHIHSFFDPLTEEYYNCELKTWQSQPHDSIDVHQID